MLQLLGYLVRDARADEREAFARHTHETTAQKPVVQGNAACVGEHLWLAAEVLLALKGTATWRGAAVTTDSRQQILEDICRTYSERGDEVVSHLDGHFALTLLKPEASRCLLAIDKMGVQRMTYAPLRDGMVFGSSAYAVSGFPTIGRRVRAQALYDFLLLHMVPAPDTVYEGVYKLRPAHLLSYADGRCDVRRYWRPSYDYRHDFGLLKAELRDSLSTAVAATAVDERTGAFLSGGLDSSTVAGVLSEQSKGPAKSFSVGFSEEAYDEIRYARISSAHFRCEAHEYYVTPRDIVDVFQRIAQTYDEPFGNSSAVPTYYCAKLAADHGVDHLLAGDGGDEIFAGNERYAKQRVFDVYNRLPRVIRGLVLEPLARALSAGSPWPFRKIKSYVDQAAIPLPDRFETWNFVYREGRARLLDPEFAAAVDTEAPLRTMRSVWDTAPSSDLIEKMLWYDWHFTLADNDLRKVGTMCELAGVRVSFPMLDSAVVQTSTHVPPSMKMRGTQLRSFFREAMSDFLPQETLRKKKQGFGLPFGVWLKSDERLRGLIYSLLADLKQRHIVSAAFLDELRDEQRAGHASYYGYIVWSLAMLEAWLAAHKRSSSPRPEPFA